jgi:hypothetical protein
MKWPEPADCVTARECLEHGNPTEAARILLHSPHRDHREVRRLLLLVSEQLIEQAGTAYHHGDLTTASEALACASRCAALPVEAIALRELLAREQASPPSPQPRTPGGTPARRRSLSHSGTPPGAAITRDTAGFIPGSRALVLLADVVERAITDGDGRTALALLKGLGLLSGEAPKIGSADPEDLAADARKHEMFRSLI